MIRPFSSVKKDTTLSFVFLPAIKSPVVKVAVPCHSCSNTTQLFSATLLKTLSLRSGNKFNRCPAEER